MLTRNLGGHTCQTAVMDETPSTENSPKKDFNKLDLSQLQGFSFGTQWSQEKSESRGRDGAGRDESPRREGERREGNSGPRDRRGFRKPAGTGTDGGAPESAPSAREARPGRDDHGRGPIGGGEFRGGPRREGSGGPRGEFRGGPRRDGQGGGERGEFRGGNRFGGGREGGRGEDRGPYISPFFNVTFYPEDASFTALSKTIRTSCRTFELFDIAKTVIGKPERFVIVLARKAPEAAGPDASVPAPAGKPAPLALSVPDGLPFETDDAATAHVLNKHLGLFFDSSEVEVDPPKGNFQIINKCGITGDLLGPPNYHRYSQILQQHFAARIKGTSFDNFKARVESVRDPEVVAQWLEKTKKTTRYTWKLSAPTAEGQAPTPVIFDSLEEARVYLLSHARDKVVRMVESARFHGTAIEQLPPGEVRRAVEGALERQRRFPLDTANALRGRLRREGFTIFKKGSKGVSYVCAVKRKFRVPGQTFAESIGNLIAFIEANPMVRAAELPAKLLGITPPAVASASPATAESTGSAPVAPTTPAPAVSPETQAKLSRLQGDLRWLVTEGYVTEFLDGRLFAPPPMVEARKKEIENTEHDPENFPESPAQETAPARVAASAPATPSDSAVTDSSPAPAETTPGADSTETPVAASDSVAIDPSDETKPASPAV